MCVSPILIPNPNRFLKSRFALYKDIESQYIYVPCGHCGECVHSRQMGIVQRVQLESLSGYPFFCTLTYNNQSLPIYECSDGFKIRYADFKDVTNMIKRIRNNDLFGRNFRYFAVSELGSKRARPHFHILFFLERHSDDNAYTAYNLESKIREVVLSQWVRNYGSRRSPVYKPLCTYVSKYIFGQKKSTYDLHYVSPSTIDGSSSDVAFYVTKYMLKFDKHSNSLQSALKLNLNPLEYREVWNKVKSRWISSLNFGFGVYGLQVKDLPRSERLDILSKSEAWKIVKDSIARSRITCDTPKFFNPENGKPMPLGRYWYQFGTLYTFDDYHFFHYRNPDQRDDNFTFFDKSPEDYFKDREKCWRQSRQIENKNLCLDLIF